VGQFEKENSAGETVALSYLKTYSVFNALEIEGLPAEFYPADRPAPIMEEGRIPAGDAFIRRTGATVRHGSDTPAYLPKPDLITMPTLAAFDSPEGYYATLLHELTHWTQPENRADRKPHGKYGSPGYAFEELVAELGAAFLCSDLGISAQPREDHACYMAGWIEALKEHPRALMSAAGAAERAVTYLHSLQASVPVPVTQAA
jgi:antirestriction protein ArdC